MSAAPATPSPLSLQLAQAFISLMPGYGRWVRSRVPQPFPSAARIRLLHVLHAAGPQIMSNLSRELEVSPRNITTLVDALEGEGLVRRRRHPSDRRATLIELTPLGTERIAKVHGQFIAALAELFSDLSDADLQELMRLVQALRASLQRRGLIGEDSGPHRAPSGST